MRKQGKNGLRGLSALVSQTLSDSYKKRKGKKFANVVSGKRKSSKCAKPAGNGRKTRKKTLLDLAIHNAKKRDGFTCRKCGKYHGEGSPLLDGHHVFKKGSSREVTHYMISNIVSLCRVPCHDWAEKNDAECKEWWRRQIPEFDYLAWASKNAGKMTLQKYDDLIQLYRGSV